MLNPFLPHCYDSPTPYSLSLFPAEPVTWENQFQIQTEGMVGGEGVALKSCRTNQIQASMRERSLSGEITEDLRHVATGLSTLPHNQSTLQKLRVYNTRCLKQRIDYDVQSGCLLPAPGLLLAVHQVDADNALQNRPTSFPAIIIPLSSLSGDDKSLSIWSSPTASLLTRSS